MTNLIPIAYLNGRLLPFSEVSLPPYDAGFVQGTTVGEQLRTFGGRLYRLDEHLQRLENSLAILGVQAPVSLGTIGELARSISRYNHALLADGDDLGLSIFVTPGIYSAFAPPTALPSPTLCIHTYPLGFQLFAGRYESGQRLVVSKIRQVPVACWPAELKCRSRMHYYLADREARQIDADARAILLDLEGHVVEASTANIVFYFADEGLVSPPRDKILPGISVAVLAEVARELNIPFHERDVRPAEGERATEIYLTSTSPCLLPCTGWNGKSVGSGQPGPMFRRLLTAWSQRVGVDIQRQAERFARRAV